MDIIEFISKFPNNDTCLVYLRNIQQNNEIKGTLCGNVVKCQIKSDRFTKCSVDKMHTPVIGCVLNKKSILPLRYWFILIFIHSTSFDNFYKVPDVKRIAEKRFHDRIDSVLEFLKLIKDNATSDLNFDEFLICCLNFKFAGKG